MAEASSSAAWMQVLKEEWVGQRGRVGGDSGLCTLRSNIQRALGTAWMPIRHFRVRGDAEGENLFPASR